MKRRDFLALAAALPWLPAQAVDTPARSLHVFGTLPAPDKVRRVFAAGAPAAVLVYAVAPDKLMG